MKIKILAEGGEMKPGPALSQKLGPAGINIGQVISKVNEATKDFKGMRVPVELDVNPSTKKFDIKVFSPPVSELLKNELKIEKGSGDHKTVQTANASIEQIIKVAKRKFPDLLCNDLKAAVKTVIGSCVSLGILIENKLAVDMEKEIDKGKFDKEIDEGIIVTSDEKRKEMDEYFLEVKTKQEQLLKQQEAAKEVEKASEVSKETQETKTPEPKKKT